MIHVGIVGCGRIADLHAPGYAGSPDARIFAVCDTNPELLEDRKREWGAERTYADFGRLLEDPNVHAVEILTPQVLHEEMVVRALRAGKHVAVQKPMTIDLPSADRMIAAAASSGRVFKVTENYVFYPPLVRARELIAAGEIGDPLGIRIRYLGGNTGGWQVPASAWEWRMRETAAGRGLVTFDHGHHLWSTAWFLLGEIEEVTAWIDSIDGIVDCPSVVMWKYRSGKRYGVCDLVHGYDLTIPSQYYTNDEWIEVTGSRGILVIRRCTGNIVSGPVIGLYRDGAWQDHEVESDWAIGFRGATHNFIDAILGRSAPMLTGQQARGILSFALAIRRSSDLHRPVALDEMDARFPRYFAWRHRRRRLRERGRKSFWSWFARADYSPLAPQAATLTRDLVGRFDARAAGDWQTLIGLELLPEKGRGAGSFSLRVQAGQAELTEGLEPDCKLVVRVPAGLWAAILLGKKRIETAVLTGQLKVEGQAEEGLKLRSVFKL